MSCLIDNDNYDAVTISNFKNEKIKSSDTQVCAECWDNIKPGIEFYQASGQFSGEDSDFKEPTNSLFVYTTCETLMEHVGFFCVR